VVEMVGLDVPLASIRVVVGGVLVLELGQME